MQHPSSAESFSDLSGTAPSSGGATLTPAAVAHQHIQVPLQRQLDLSSTTQHQQQQQYFYPPGYYYPAPTLMQPQMAMVPRDIDMLAITDSTASISIADNDIDSESNSKEDTRHRQDLGFADEYDEDDDDDDDIEGSNTEQSFYRQPYQLSSQDSYTVNVFNLSSKYTTKKSLKKLMNSLLSGSDPDEITDKSIDIEATVIDIQLYKNPTNEVCWSSITIKGHDATMRLLNLLNGYTINGLVIQAMLQNYGLTRTTQLPTSQPQLQPSTAPQMIPISQNPGFMSPPTAGSSAAFFYPYHYPPPPPQVQMPNNDENNINSDQSSIVSPSLGTAQPLPPPPLPPPQPYYNYLQQSYYPYYPPPQPPQYHYFKPMQNRSFSYSNSSSNAGTMGQGSAGASAATAMRGNSKQQQHSPIQNRYYNDGSRTNSGQSNINSGGFKPSHGRSQSMLVGSSSGTTGGSSTSSNEGVAQRGGYYPQFNYGYNNYKYGGMNNMYIPQEQQGLYSSGMHSQQQQQQQQQQQHQQPLYHHNHHSQRQTGSGGGGGYNLQKRYELGNNYSSILNPEFDDDETKSTKSNFNYDYKRRAYKNQPFYSSSTTSPFENQTSFVSPTSSTISLDEEDDNFKTTEQLAVFNSNRHVNPMRLFIGNIPFTSTYASLSAHLNSIPKISLSQLFLKTQINGASKGFAIALCYNEHDAVELIKNFNGVSFEGRELVVRFDQLPGVVLRGHELRKRQNSSTRFGMRIDHRFMMRDGDGTNLESQTVIEGDEESGKLDERERKKGSDDDVDDDKVEEGKEKEKGVEDGDKDNKEEGDNDLLRKEKEVARELINAISNLKSA
ncbi:hypothetical protein CANARDRAFT_25028 [[Candida] arabinofermentans NRRL YB-2248]|uniref:RRM domain-containing protein n=1 Tax=[Candida] arabinofermentans NRRL YB-2248 TaxID=983967 RepID=A0A1E4SV46_9ASCO|nr:hypothetical protein CANARDRAFT_25028 [[Candida] arabinofermentans NRRL YB-2248]